MTDLFIKVELLSKTCNAKILLMRKTLQDYIDTQYKKLSPG